MPAAASTDHVSILRHSVSFCKVPLEQHTVGSSCLFQVVMVTLLVCLLPGTAASTAHPVALRHWLSQAAY